MSERLQQMLNQYYDFLAISALKWREAPFWAYHRKRLAELGYPFRRRRLGVAILRKVASLLVDPLHTIRRLMPKSDATAKMAQSAR